MRLLVLACALGALAAGAAAAPEKEKTLGVPGSVEEIAADGSRVAISTHYDDGKTECDRAEEWDASTGRSVRFTTRRPCHALQGAHSDAVVGMALAGRRALWVAYEYSNHPYCTGVYTATATSPKPVSVPLSLCDGTNSDEQFELAGDGALLAELDYYDCEYYEECPDGIVRLDLVLRRLDGTKLVRLAAGDRVYRLFGVGGGRIVVGEKSGPVDVYSSAGKKLLALPFKKNEALAAAISGQDLVVRTKSQYLQYDAATGSSKRSFDVTRKLRDLDGGIVVYTQDTTIHLLRLADGKDVAFATVPGLVDAQLEPAGLFYAYNKPHGGTKPGRVVFVPRAAALRRLS